jgi:hypothetical protein
VAAVVSLISAIGIFATGGAQAAVPVVYYASPSGAGTTCSAAAPCSLPGAQTVVRAALAAGDGTSGVTVLVEDGTYRLTSPLQFGAADSGTAADPVIWEAAPGAHPVISGATQVTGWSQVPGSGIWKATVPANSASRQLYVNGLEAPVAQETLSELGFAGGWTGSSTGYDITSDMAAVAWFDSLTPAQLAGVEFEYPGGTGSGWTAPECRVASVATSAPTATPPSATTLTMDEPCWQDTTNRSSYIDASGGLPSMSTSQLPAVIEDAYALIHPGQWFLDSAADTLYYEPTPGQQMASADVELPQLQTLLEGSGTLAAPLHDVTFSGLQFSYATWNAPSAPTGFPEVQSNLYMNGAANQGMCTFSTPAGTCPWGAIAMPQANVAFSASDDITITGDRFSNLGGAGLSIKYGSSNDLVQGNEFTDIASTALLLGCTYDPNPTVAADAAGIKANCTTNPAAVANDTIGDNEILSHTTVTDNVIHNIGTGYNGASGITLLYSQYTTISNNDIYDTPYTAITAGVIEGHVDDSVHPQNTTNINAYNTISDNVMHDINQDYHDGGAIYAEGHQAQYQYEPNGTTINQQATLAAGLTAEGNVTYNGDSDNAYYDDAGSEWINWDNNVEFGGNGSESAAQGGCDPTGNFWITDNYFSDPDQSYGCLYSGTNVVSTATGNTTIPEQPQPGDVPSSLLAGAGLSTGYATLTGAPAQLFYASAKTSSTAADPDSVLIAGEGFTPTTPVYFGSVPSTSVTDLSEGFMIAAVPSEATTTTPAFAPPVPVPTFTSPVGGGVNVPSSVHAAGAGVAGDAVAVTDTSAGVTAPICTVTVGGDGSWACPQATLPDGLNVLSAVQTSPAGGTSVPSASVVVYIGGEPLPTTRINDTDLSISYSGFSYSSDRGDGDYENDVHYATENGSTCSLTFIGTGVAVYGEENDDEGTIGISVDGGIQQVVDTSGSGSRQSNLAVFSAEDLAAGQHTIVITKLSGQYAVLDGFETDYVAGVPSTPTIANAVAGDASAAVSFTPPANPGGSAVTGYTVTAADSTNPPASPVTASGTASPIAVPGLTNGDTYTVTVTATNGQGVSEPSAASNSITPTAPVVSTTPPPTNPPPRTTTSGETDSSTGGLVAAVPDGNGWGSLRLVGR